MIREDRELFAELARLNKRLVAFAWGVMDDAVPADEQHEVARQLVDLAEAVQARAQREESRVIEGEIVEDRGDTAGNAASHGDP